MSLKNFVIKLYFLRQRKKWNKRLKGRIPPKEALREWINKMTARFEVPEGINIKKFNVDHIQTEWLIPTDAIAAEEMILYLHGGGYMMGSIDTHRSLAAKLAIESRAKVLLIDYALAPENPYPAALNDSLKVYTWLTENGYKSVSIILAGDSAGGGLALATVLAAREKGMALPAGLVLLSPWTDLAGTGESMTSKAKKDPVLTAETLPKIGAWYAGDIPLDDPRVSPLYADLTGLPPMLIQVGTSEILLDDSTRLAERAKAAGVEVELDVWEGQMHVWQMLWKELPKARKAIEKIANFTSKRLGQGRIMYHELSD